MAHDYCLAEAMTRTRDKQWHGHKRLRRSSSGTLKTLGLYKPISKSYLDAISHRRRFDYSLHQTTIVRPHSFSYFTFRHGSSCHFR